MASSDYCLKIPSKECYQVRFVAISPDGKTIAAGSWSKVSLWCSNTGRLLADLNNPPDQGVVRDFSTHSLPIAFSPAGAVLVTGCADGVILVWDTANACSATTPACDRSLMGKLEGHSDVVISVEFVSNGDNLLSESGDGTVRLWDMSTLQQLMEWNGYMDIVASVPASADVAESDCTGKAVQIYDSVTETKLLEMNLICRGGSDEKNESNGKVGANSGGLNDQSLCLWDTSTGDEIAKLDGHTATILCIAFSQDGRSIASAPFGYGIC